MKRYYFSAAGVLFSMSISAAELPDRQAQLPSVAKEANAQYLMPSPLSSIPKGEFGDKVRKGYQLFVNSQQMRDTYVGNELNCVNCHMNAGNKANASPLWGAYMAYPAYRKKNDKVNSFEERIQGCFTYSMNGKAPESGSEPLVAISAYSYWLVMSGLMNQFGITGPVPEMTDVELLKGGNREDFPLPETVTSKLDQKELTMLPGRGFPKLAKPELAYSVERGEAVYQAHCQTCHADDGQGYKMANVSALPPLWGPQSYNWGAGMHRVNTAANFIYENMPLGKSIQLTVQQAWDVAAFVNAHERPQDPRYKGNVAETQAKYHQHEGFYGKPSAVDPSVILGSKSYPIFPASK
ncbi:c-type cytochrome [Shewanella sp. 1_MG-2023]|uniref:c-type cytochrome n=1 Tax=unclassified Shewanella TaxID=196818 RepID=UPI0026E3C0E5|nr:MULTISPECIES: c-type cytochrome [unclassified Shewanella]MDO6611214.1 c-type cytochrome [Shewanella sp. 7_MG-2023]MDO6770909.1 c-type cytochrome [Shewanella sp. 2_MG-2023]MDO6794704.1 c-type cytochrome [Shewanella sp. 1_MG-2023]